MEKIVYADHSATTYTKPEVLNEMLPYFTSKYGNASSLYSLGRISRRAVDTARYQVATAINADVSDIYFTAGGSESDNLIIMGIARANKCEKNHIITTKIEHLAVLNSCARLEKEGFDVTYLNVNKDGLIDLDELEKAIKPNTMLISIMFANNEIGTIEPIKKIGEIAKKHGIIFHTDAVQAIGNVKIDVKDLNIDALSMSGHKFYGPKGIGAAYIKNEIRFEPVIYGGHQELQKRAGTENVPGIVGIGKAIEIADKNIDSYNQKLTKIRDYFLDQVKQKVNGVTVNGSVSNRLPGNANITIKGVDGESMLLMLDMDGICASSGSACTAGSVDPSHVLTAIGLNSDDAKCSIRFTFGDENTIEDADYIVDKLVEISKKLRKKE